MQVIPKPEMSILEHLEVSIAEGSEPDWLQNSRLKSLAQYRLEAWPTRKTEDWKYLDLSGISQAMYVLADPSVDAIHNKDLDGLQFSVVNGRFNVNSGQDSDQTSGPALLEGLLVCSLSQAILDENIDQDLFKKTLEIFPPQTKIAAIDNPPIKLKNTGPVEKFRHLNAALWQDGAFIQVAENTKLESMIVIEDHLSGKDSSVMTFHRNVFRLAKNASATIVVNQTSDVDADSFKNISTFIELAENSNLTLIVLQNESDFTSVIQDTVCHLHDSANLNIYSVQLSGKLLRNDLNVALLAPNAECHLYDFYHTTGNQVVDNHLRVDHLSHHATSHQFYKGIVDDKSTAVFNGKVLVHPLAVKSDATQKNANLLLSNKANLYTKPELEIYNDDVKCAHGATVGDLDEAALFYLQTRGIDPASAKALLTEAFAMEVFDSLKNAALKQYLRQQIIAKFSEG